MEEILKILIPSVISGVITLIGVVMANSKHDAVIDTRLEELTREVRKHNNFAERIPVIENKVKNIEDKVKYFHSA